MNRPQYQPDPSLPKALQDKMVESSRRKWIWVAPDGATFFVNDESRARNSAAKQGGTVYAPEN